MENLLTATAEIVALAFVLIVVTDFAAGLIRLWKSAYKEPQRPAPAPQETLVTVTQPEPQPVQLPVLEDPWLSVNVSPCTDDCCHLTEWGIVSRPQLLLPPGLEVAQQPELASMPATALRKLCSQRGIKWRNKSGGKHLSKAEMIIALTA